MAVICIDLCCKYRTSKSGIPKDELWTEVYCYAFFWYPL